MGCGLWGRPESDTTSNLAAAAAEEMANSQNFPCTNKSFMGFPGLIFFRMVKNLPAMRETRVQSLGREDPLEKAMAIHSSTLAWKIPWTEEPDRLQGYSPWGLK